MRKRGNNRVFTTEVKEINKVKKTKPGRERTVTLSWNA